MKNKQIIIGAVVLVVVLAVIGGILVLSSNKKSEQKPKETTLENTDVVPTVDSSVQVDLKGVSDNHEALVTIKNVPSGTDSIDYSLSYTADIKGEQSLQGAIGKMPFKSGDKDTQKQITLGTCSSGTCTYHKVIGKIKVELNFSGNYGSTQQKLFAKEFDL